MLVWRSISICGVKVSGLDAVTQKLFLTEFCNWLAAGDVVLPLRPQLLSMGCAAFIASNGNGDPSHWSGNPFCARLNATGKSRAPMSTVERGSISCLAKLDDFQQDNRELVLNPGRVTKLFRRGWKLAASAMLLGWRERQLSLPKIPAGYSKIDQLMPCQRVLTDLSHHRIDRNRKINLGRTVHGPERPAPWMRRFAFG